MLNFRILIVVSLAATLLMIGVGMIVAILPQRVLALSGTMHQVSLIASVFALFYLMFQLPNGHLADRFGAKPFLILGYALCSLSGVVFFVAPDVGMILIGRAAQGMGEAPIWALGPALLSLAYPHQKGKVIGIYNAAIHAGLTIGPLLGILLLQETDSSSPFLVFALLGCAGGVLVLVGLPRFDFGSAIDRAPSDRKLTKTIFAKDPLITLVGTMLYGAGYGTFISVLPAYLSLTRGFDPVSIAFYFAMFYAAISLSQLVVGPLSDTHGRKRYMVIGLTAASVGLACFGIAGSLLIYAMLAVASLGLGIFCVSSMAYLNECVPPSQKGLVSGAYYLAWGAGYGLGPLFVGTLSGGNSLAGYYALATMLGCQAVATAYR